MPRAKKSIYSPIAHIRATADKAIAEENVAYMRTLATSLEGIVSDLRAIAGWPRTGSPPRMPVKPDRRVPPPRFSKVVVEKIVRLAGDASLNGGQVRDSFSDDLKLGGRVIKILLPHFKEGGIVTVYSPGKGVHRVHVAKRG